MGELLATIEIPQYIDSIELSKKQRPKYYRKSKGKWKPRNLPKTYKSKLTSGEYFLKKGYLIDKETNKKILANPQSAGKPKYEKFSGNKLLSGYGSPFIRAKLVGALKDFYRPFVQDFIEDNGPITTFPLRITWDIYTTVEEAPNWDLFNLFFYYKYFEDSLFETTDVEKDHPILYKNEKLKQLIPDDNVQYITWSPGPRLIPVDTWDNRKFIFKIYHDDRTELRRSPWV
jgi:hypothetical protein